MKFWATLLFLSLGYLESANAICATGEVGIGRKMVYQWNGQQETLMNDHWVIAANNCNDIAVSGRQFQDDACKAGPGYGSGNGVSECDGNGKPGFVWTKGGNFHNCYSVSQTCATGPYLYEGIHYCCKRWV